MLCILFFCAAYGLPAGLLDNPDIAWEGVEALRAGDFKKALAALKKDTAVADTGFHLFKLGCAYQGLKDWTNAYHYFKACAEKSPRYAPFAYEKTGDISLTQGRLENALNSYRLAATQTYISSYADLLYSKIKRIVKEHGQELGSIPWIEEFQEKEIISPPVFADTLIRAAKAALFKAVDSLIQQRVDPGEYGNKICSVCPLLPRDSTCDTLFSTKTLFILSRLAYTCRQFRIALAWLDKTSLRSDFEDQIEKQQYLYARASLYFRMENYQEAVAWGEKYHKKYNPEPSIVYLIARAYRNMGKADKAEYWYKKHVEYFPRLEKSTDIIWLLAWQKEEISDYGEARKLYKKLFARHTNKPKADAACFRYALTYCKERNYKAALEEFNYFLDKFPSSDFIFAARFWSARCFFSMSQYDNARKNCSFILKAAPTDYYAYRARELLVLMGDSLQTLPVDTSFSVQRTCTWLDSLSGTDKMQLAREDTSALLTGASLASLGMMNYSHYFLQPIEEVYSNNFYVQFELARLYTQFNEPALAYSVARRFAWRIPLTSQQGLPSTLYALLYPSFYHQYITTAARLNNLEPELISAVIRQESIFNAQIVSPAGAIGLMQIMPYTGQEIASDLKEEFSADSLYFPSLSIRYGSYYIRKLLNRFNDNLILAIAGYNGGPHNARRWMAINSDDGFDMFVEDISFSETNKYVKKVLANYWTYKELAKIRLYPKK